MQYARRDSLPDRPGITCQSCGGPGPGKYDTNLCETCYRAVLASGLRISKAMSNNRHRLRGEAKALAYRVMREGQVSFLDIAVSDVVIDMALAEGWVTETAEALEPGDTEPSAVPLSTRAQVLVRALGEHGPMSYPQAAEALGLTSARLRSVAAFAMSTGHVVTTGRTHAARLHLPDAETPARTLADERADRLATLIAAETAPIGKAALQKATGYGPDMMDKALATLRRRGTIQTRNGPGGGYSTAPVQAT